MNNKNIPEEDIDLPDSLVGHYLTIKNEANFSVSICVITIDNKEVKEFGYNYKLYPELYIKDADLTTCSNVFKNKSK